MIECNSRSRILYQQLREDQCGEACGQPEHGYASVLNRLQRILKSISTYTEANVHSHNGYEAVPLGGGSYMFIRCEPESIFREGK